MNFGRRPSCRQPVERALQLVDRHSVAVHLDLRHLGLIGPERRHRSRIGRSLGDDHVARVDQGLADQVDHLLAARRDDHLAGIDRGALRRHHLDDALHRRRHPLGRAILQRPRRGLRGDLGHQLRVQLGREGARVRQTARQRDHVRALGQRHHLAHGRAFHAARPGGEQRLVARELMRGGPRPAPVACAADRSVHSPVVSIRRRARRTSLSVWPPEESSIVLPIDDRPSSRTVAHPARGFEHASASTQ